MIFYDKECIDENGDYKVVLDFCVDEIHHDVIDYYDSDTTEYSVRVREVDDELFMLITLLNSGEEVVVENGSWYFTT